MSTQSKHKRELQPVTKLKPDPSDRNPEKQYIDTEVGVMSANQAADYQIHEDEKDRYHVALTKRVNNQSAKQYEDKVVYESFTPREWSSMNDDGSGNRFLDEYDKVDILHDPTAKGTQPPVKPAHGANGTPPGTGKPETQNGGLEGTASSGTGAMDEDEDNDTDKVKVYVSLPAAKKKYKALYGVHADESATIDDINELIAAKMTDTETE